jgi:serine protease inhibitor
LISHKIGIYDVFFDANLSKISTDNEVFVSHLIQKVEIDVNEKGTIAAAKKPGPVSNEATKVLANGPFIYLIVDKRMNLLLFSGVVINPNNATSKPNTQKQVFSSTVATTTEDDFLY